MLESLLMIVIYIIVAGLIFWLVTWAIDFVGLPEPFNKVAKVLIVVIVVIFLIMMILRFLPSLGHGFG